MSSTAADRKAALFSSGTSDLAVTDPEFTQFFSAFAFEEVPKDVHIPAADADLAVLAALIGEQAVDVFRRMVPAAMAEGVEPAAIRETIYQGTAYLGIGRTLPFLETFDSMAEELGLTLPLPAAGAVTPEYRVEKGEAVQIEAFGPHMKGFAKSGNEDVRHINRWLSGNCFGDYYTRAGLTLRQREMITFCFIAAQGGCEPQLTAHATGNMNVGNSREYLIGVISACLPYIGYPRSLNALTCVNKAAQSRKESEEKS